MHDIGLQLILNDSTLMTEVLKVSYPLEIRFRKNKHEKLLRLDHVDILESLILIFLLRVNENLTSKPRLKTGLYIRNCLKIVTLDK